MLPSIFGENLFDDWFDFPTLRDLRNIDRKLYGRNASHEMEAEEQPAQQPPPGVEAPQMGSFML